MYHARLSPASSSPLAAFTFVSSLNVKIKNKTNHQIFTLLPTFFLFKLLDPNSTFLQVCVNIFHNCLSARSKVAYLSSLETKMFLETLPNILDGLFLGLFLMEIMQLESEKWLSTGVSTCYFEVVIRSQVIVTQY